MVNIDDLLKKDKGLIVNTVKMIKKPAGVDFDDLCQEAHAKYFDLLIGDEQLKYRTSENASYIKKAIFNHLISYLDNGNNILMQEMEMEMEKEINTSDINIDLIFLHMYPQEQYIIENAFLYDQKSFNKISKELGISTTKLSSIYKSLLSKLKKVLSQDFNNSLKKEKP